MDCPALLYVGLSCPVARIALVKPDKVHQIENLLLMQAQSGRLSEKVSIASDQDPERVAPENYSLNRLTAT